MKIENIGEGRVFKNWKVLCEVLEVEPKSHSYRVKQEKEFRCYFNWIKEGHKIIITEVYEEPRGKEDGRSKGNKVIFKNGELGDSLILTLSKATPRSETVECKTCYYSVRDLARDLGLIGEYHHLFYDYPEQLKILGLYQAAKDIVNDYSMLRNQVLRACKELKEREIVIEYRYDTFIRHKESIDGNDLYTYRNPTEDELKIIRECQEDTVKYFNENKEEFNYRGGDLKDYNKIHRQLPTYLRQNVWNYCFKLCRSKITDYINHSSKLMIKYDVEQLIEAFKYTKSDANLIVNRVYSEKRISDSDKRHGEKIESMQKEIEMKASGKGFGKVAEMRKREVEREHGITLEEAIRLYDKSRKARFIAYTTKDLFDSLTTEEDREELQLYIDGLLYKEDLADTIKNWRDTVTVFKTGRLIKRDIYSRAKYQLLKNNFDEFEINKDMVITYSHIYEPGLYSQGEIANGIHLPTDIRMFTEYTYDGEKGRVVIHMIVNKYYYTRIETRTMFHVECLALSILNRHPRLASNHVIFGEMTKERKQDLEKMLSDIEEGIY